MLKSLVSRIRGVFLIGYDVFISYSRADSLVYAQALFHFLDSRGFAPFIDAVDTRPGTKTPAVVLRRLRRCSQLVIVASPQAARSTNVKDELELFAKTGRNIVIIDVGGGSASAVWSADALGLPKHLETREKLAAGVPSAGIGGIVLSSAQFVRRATRLRQSVLAASALGVFAGVFLLGSLIVSARTVGVANDLAYRASAGARLEQDGSEALKLSESEQLRGLLASLRAASATKDLGKPALLVTDVAALPAVSPITALLTSLSRAHERAELVRLPELRRAVFSPDGRHLAATFAKDTLRIWAVETGKLVATMKPGERGVDSIGFSPDGKLLVSSGLAQTTLWDAESGRELIKLTGDGFFRDFAFSADSNVLAITREADVQVWQLSPPKRLVTLTADREFVGEIAIASDGTQLVTGGGEGVIRHWHVPTGGKIRELPIHKAFVSKLALSHDGRILASGSGDGTVRLTRLETGEELETVVGFDGYVSELSFSPDDKRLATTDLGHTTRIWDLTESRKNRSAAECRIPDCWRLEPRISQTWFTGDGMLFTGSQDGRIHLWSVASHEEHAAWPADATWFTLTMAASGKLLASAGESGALKLWDRAWPSPAKRIVHGSVPGVRKLSPDGQVLLTSSDELVQLWNVASGQLSGSWPEKGLRQAVFSADGRRITSVGIDAAIALRDAATGRTINSWSVPRPPPNPYPSIPNVTLSPEGATAIAADFGGNLQLLRAENGEPLTAVPKELLDRARGLAAIAFSPDGRIAVLKEEKPSPRGSDLSVVELATGKRTTIVSGMDAEYAVLFAFDGKTVLTVGRNPRRVKAWDTTTGRDVTPAPLAAADPENLQISPVSNVFYTLGEQVNVFELRSGALLGSLSLEDFPVSRAVFSPAGKTMVLLRNGGAQALVWNISDKAPLAVLESVQAVAFSPNGQVLASIDSETSILWEARTARRLATLVGERDLRDLEFTADGKELLLYGERTTSVWPLALDAWLRAGCSWVEYHLRLHPDDNRYALPLPDGTVRSSPICAQAR